MFSIISYAGEDFEFEGNVNSNKPYALISLGCNCWQAQALRTEDTLELNDTDFAKIFKANGLRDAAFPFDWLLTLDNDKLIQCLDERFQYFNEESYFVRYDKICLENTRYNFKFTHDWPYDGVQLTPERHKGQLAFIKNKYTRRIARFEKLSNFKGKVFFIRAFSADSDYNDQSSQKLYEALKRFFPDLNFTLVIINWSKHSIFKVTQNEWIKEYRITELTNFTLLYPDIYKDLLHEFA